MMPESKGKNVPKFGSFRPKPKPEPAIQTEVKCSETGSFTESEHRSKKQYERDKKRSHHRWDRSKSREKSCPLHPPTQHLQRQQGRRGDDLDLFIVDRKGDEKNLMYGSLHRYSVPSFHRYGAGLVLGASPTMRIDRGTEDETDVVLTDIRIRRTQLREKYIFSRVAHERTRLLRIRPQRKMAITGGTDDDYITLQPYRKRRNVMRKDLSSSDDDVDYRSIYGKSQDKIDSSEHDLEFVTESESSSSDHGRDTNLDLSVRQKNVELSQRVTECPHDIEAWLSLIRHQELLIRREDDRRRITQAEIRSTAEIKIHMYEKALENAKCLKDRERLLIGLMCEGEKIWELKTQANRWEQISKDNIDSLVLWTKFLNFKQSTFSIFRYEEVKDVYLQRIRLLLQAARNAPEGPESLHNQLFYVLLRLTVFMRDAGYSELAVAIWQALLEINFCGPSANVAHVDCINLFKDFWESEVPRIGEYGAMGWRHYLENEATCIMPEASVDETTDSLDSHNLFESWAVAERLRIRSARAPAKSLDDVVEDDPFRVILFTDIEDYLVALHPDSDGTRQLCMNAFLLFCRLPPLVELDYKQAENWYDAFTFSVSLGYDAGYVERDILSKTRGDNVESVPQILYPPFPNFVLSSENLFVNILGKQGVNRPYLEPYAGDNGPVSYNFIRKALRQLTQSWLNDGLAEQYLSFEFRNEPATIKKTAKSLLKQHPSSLRLYHAYALIEWVRGNKEIADGVFSAALSMGKSLTEDKAHVGSIRLWTSWIWACFEDGQGPLVLKHLLCIPDGVPNPTMSTSPALVLRAKQQLALNRDISMFSGIWGAVVMYSECLALLEYLSEKSGDDSWSSRQGDISNALEVYNSVSRSLQKRKQLKSQELLLQSACRLLYYHAQNGPYRPAFLRENLAHWLQLFPQNTVFLCLYSWNESRTRIDNRVRHILIKSILVLENDSLTSRVFAISYEINHGTIYSVKSAFENSLSSPSSRYSAGLWSLYILYCLQTAPFRCEAKDVWYRAVRTCPWAKELYILGFAKLAHCIDFGELKGTWRVMGEKELRVHVDLEDTFDELESSRRCA